LKQAVKKLNKHCAVNIYVKAVPADCILCGENEADIIKEHFWKQTFVPQKKAVQKKTPVYSFSRAAKDVPEKQSPLTLRKHQT